MGAAGIRILKMHFLDVMLCQYSYTVRRFNNSKDGEAYIILPLRVCITHS